MSHRHGGDLISGAHLHGGGGLGVLGSDIPSTGDDGASFLYNDLSLPADANKEIRGLILTVPSDGTFFAYEDGSFSLLGAADGTYTFTYTLFVDGVDEGDATATVTVGAATATGTVAVTLANATLSATGDLANKGEVSVTLEDASLSATGAKPATEGSVTATLADASLSAHGRRIWSPVDSATGTWTQRPTAGGNWTTRAAAGGTWSAAA